MLKPFKWNEYELIRKDAEILWADDKPPDDDEREKFCDSLEYVLSKIYAYGWKDAEQTVGSVDPQQGRDSEVVNLEIDGETFRDRVMKETTIAEILRLIDTEAHRDYNTGVTDCAEASGKPYLRKRWFTMRDSDVRDSHKYLEGMEVGLNDRFYTSNEDSALRPGGFHKIENNANCRCWVVIMQYKPEETVRRINLT